MPIDYYYIFGEECSYCGGFYECNDHVRAYSKGGVYTLPCCNQCNGSKYNKGLKTWLREVRDYWPEKWDEIVEHHYRRRNWLSQIVHAVQYEW